MIEIDLHLHSSFSSDTHLEIDKIAQVFRAADRPIVTITDHGTIAGGKRLGEILPERSLLLGLEVTTQEGDFLVFSTDEAYLASLSSPPASVKDLRRGETEAIIWAHPRVSQRAAGWEAPKLPEVQEVVGHIDGLEVFNGTMLALSREGVVKRNYFSNLVRIAINHSLAMTGGSDAHEWEMLLRCGTQFPGEFRQAAEVIAAIKQRRVWPVYDHKFFGFSIPITG